MDVLVSFPEYPAEHAVELPGEKHVRRCGANPAVLVKLPDPAEQLPMQVHPTKEDARKYLNSSHGKTEAWLVLATREVNGEAPYLLVGFNEQLDPELFTKECLAGKFERGLSMLNKIAVKPGDTIIIRGDAGIRDLFCGHPDSESCRVKRFLNSFHSPNSEFFEAKTRRRSAFLKRRWVKPAGSSGRGAFESSRVIATSEGCIASKFFNTGVTSRR